jgi:hypothetical protein
MDMAIWYKQYMEKHQIYVERQDWRRFRSTLMRMGYPSASDQLRFWIRDFLQKHDAGNEVEKTDEKW